MSDFETKLYRSSTSSRWDENFQSLFPNRAMYFGDGLFETMIFDGKEIRFFDLHLNRLYVGLELLGLDHKAISKEEIQLVIENHSKGRFSRIRWTLYRAGLGKYSPESKNLDQVIEIKNFVPAPLVKEKAVVSQQIVLSASRFSKLKTISALPYVLAAKERMDRTADEIILLDTQGNIAEAGSSNLFWQKGSLVYTPSLESGCIAGVGRSVILDHLKKQSIQVKEGLFNLDTLLEADLVWTSNVTGISMLGELEGKFFKTQMPAYLQKIF